MSPLGSIMAPNGVKIVFRSPGGGTPRTISDCWVSTTATRDALEITRGVFYKRLESCAVKILYPGEIGMVTEKPAGSSCGYINYRGFVTVCASVKSEAASVILNELVAHCERVMENKAQKNDGCVFTNGGYKEALEFTKRALMPAKEQKQLQWEERRQQEDIDYYLFLSDCLKWGRDHPRKQYFTFQLVEWEANFGGYHRRQVEAWSRRAAEDGFFNSPRKGVVDIAQVTYTGERVNIYDFSREFYFIELVYDYMGDDFFWHRTSLEVELRDRLKLAAAFGATRFNLPMLCSLLNKFMVSDEVRQLVCNCKHNMKDFGWNWEDDTKMVLVRCR